MIIYKTGNLLTAPVEALVNTVNTVGVMGKGIALQFKETFTENYKAYSAAVKRGEVRTGKMFVTELYRTDQLRYIINFPTKQHWKSPSQMAYIREGLEDLRRVLTEYKIGSVALPPLGCGNGGLDWNAVRPLIEKVLGDLDMEVLVYEPSSEIATRMAEEALPKSITLTPARAMLLYLLYHYRQLGEFASEFAAEKLMYFLQRTGEKQLKLDFQKHFYGPYSGKVRHVLYALNGRYINGVSHKSNRPFDPIALVPERKEEITDYLSREIGKTEQARLNTLINLIDGFQSPAGLELLASLDYLIQEEKTFDFDVLRNGLQKWSSRKKKMFSDYQIEIALKRLLAYQTTLYSE
jgi:O-acetyl-ADP-ribose deacetylase (regulator of RNase III)